jgi:hypothetical protein
VYVDFTTASGEIKEQNLKIEKLKTATINVIERQKKLVFIFFIFFTFFI